MSITKTEVLHRCEVYPAMDPNADPTTNKGNPTLRVNMAITFDDPDDSELPVVSNHLTNLSRFDEDGSATDVSGQPQIVQDICAAVWA
jgi:hypothetical protein